VLSVQHEFCVSLLREDVRLVPELLRRAFGLTLGHGIALVEGAESLGTVTPTEYRADAVLVRRDDSGGIVEAFVLEVQLRRDARKRYTWPQYVTGLHARLRCPVTLVVFAPSVSTARWCAMPIDVRRGRTVVSPLVIGPAEVPKIMRVEEGRAWPELAVLSAIAHGKTAPPEDAAAIGVAAIAAAAKLDDERGPLYADMVLTTLGSAARALLEAQMRIEGYEYTTEFLRRAKAEGKAEGIAEGKAEGIAEGARRMLIAVFEARGWRPTPPTLQRIDACTDEGQLERWARRAIVVDDIDDVFA
jgi:hypothetical protein